MGRKLELVELLGFKIGIRAWAAKPRSRATRASVSDPNRVFAYLFGAISLLSAAHLESSSSSKSSSCSRRGGQWAASSSGARHPALSWRYAPTAVVRRLRLGRLVHNLLLVRLGYPPAIIFKGDRRRYQ